MGGGGGGTRSNDDAPALLSARVTVEAGAAFEPDSGTVHARGGRCRGAAWARRTAWGARTARATGSRRLLRATGRRRATGYCASPSAQALDELS